MLSQIFVPCPVDTEIWIALAAAFIAFCALGISIWQGFLMRQHSRLSVKPWLVLHRDAIEGNAVEIHLVNAGLGPALVKDLYYTIEDTKICTEHPLKTALQTVGLEEELVIIRHAELGSIDPTSPILANQKFRLLLVKLRNDISEDQEFKTVRNVKEKTANITIHISYQSIYEEEIFRYKQTLG